MPSDNRTEKATGYKRNKERRKGTVCRSTEVVTALMILAMGLVLAATGSRLFESFLDAYRKGLGAVSRYGVDRLQAMDARVITHIVLDIFQGPLIASLPLILTIFGAALLACYGQVGLLITPEVMELKLGAMNPVNGLKKLVSLRSFVTTFVGFVKLAIIGGVTYLVADSAIRDVIGIAEAPLPAAAQIVGGHMNGLILRVAVVMLVLAIFDYAYQRWQYEKDLKMTRQEVKDENKLLEGDPTVKGRIRRAQIAMVRRRMMNDVPTADLVVKNPSHYAVALKYESSKMTAPTVVAKGADLLAKRILQIAEENRVPVITNPPVARGLYRLAEIGDEIPMRFYRVVAKMLAQVYRAARTRPLGAAF